MADNRRKRLGRGTMTNLAMRSLSKGVPRFQLEAAGVFGSDCDSVPDPAIRGR
jgi:hypothetical protein